MWDVANFRIAENCGMACSFGFELQVHDARTGNSRVLHSDGLLLSDGRVRFNREDQLGQLAGELELEPRVFLEELAGTVRKWAQAAALSAV